jgi:hypothetical protein
VTAVNDDSNVEEEGSTDYNCGIIWGDMDHINFFLVILDLKLHTMARLSPFMLRNID